MNGKIVFLIVIYDKKFSDSTTIMSLLSSGISGVSITIHNNGPRSIDIPLALADDFRRKNILLELVNCVSNIPLSILYNKFIEDNASAEKIIFLDDDSEISNSFLAAIYENDYDIQMPLIISRNDKQIMYPITDGKSITKEGFLKPYKTHSIGSGLVINRTFIDKFKKNNMKLFDERYALYGVDFSLFRRAWKLVLSGESFVFKTSSYLTHSLSRVEGKDNIFRRKERLIDIAITTRNYPSIRGTISFCKTIMKNIFLLNIGDVIMMCEAFCYGKHPRCRR
ncbi:TPA: glycosyltransferase family 2 protein [Raoultella planticola]